ncbi:ABC transporter permease [Desulfotalea psychrophila]|uniref:Related to lipoprotein releasing system transmembrane protein n=1 Tax=Desulfotalea psychrophila (strain LSv54 / DSM 12343) TaxID=177439 RepID=Q6AMB4_DESPS|nr:FtsX-like permease family protein [Desulfotalea psychrophila]CAG36511.1 related to lipoprotein releasing system transmembrane protein [Desulfotalea psychrophila LSv54]
MIPFLLKGLLRDRSRSLFPIITVSIGVMLTVFLQAWMQGEMGDIARSNAKFSTGHVKIMSRAYAKNKSQIPNDLALLGADNLLQELRASQGELNWVKRIRFGGLVDVPDARGETSSQGPAMGLAVDLLSPESTEIATLNIREAIVRGRFPLSPGEILLGDKFATKLKAHPGETVTLLSSTMYGSMSMQNFVIAGTIKFGVNAMDRGALLVDIADIQHALDMDDAAGELLGYFRDGIYHDSEALRIAETFNEGFATSDDEYAPVMFALRNQDGLGEYLDLANYISLIASAVFIMAMSIVLWNVGLIGGLRRYGEMGLRLAIGENKHHVYASIIIEALIIGVIGSIIGTLLGLLIAWYFQAYGLDIGSMTKNSSMMISNIIRAEISYRTYYIGFIPGIASTLLGAALSGIGIYKRQTAQLFKELET